MGNKTGTKFAQQQPGRIGKTESGSYTDVPFETTDFSEAVKYIIMAESNGILFDFDESFGKFKIVLHYPYNYTVNQAANEPPIDLWEMNSPKSMKSVLDSSNPLANACNQGELYVLGLFQQNKANYIIVPNNDTTAPTSQTGSIAYPETTYDAGQSAPARLSIAVGSPARTLADLLAIGVESFPINVPELKHTRTVNSAYPIQEPNDNVGQIISTSSLYDLENVPNNNLFILPDYIDPAPAFGKPILRYGWYKNAPSVNQIARRKFQIIESWEYGLWATAVYGNPL